jgi:molecular chaperone GrpE
MTRAEPPPRRAAPTEPSQEEREVERDIDEMLAETRRERDEYLELAKRTKADFENYRKRVAGEAEEAALRGVAILAAQLIPAIDNLERALRAAGVDPAGEDEPAEETGALERGVLLTYRDLRATLERAGVEAYSPAPSEETFDPAWHEALQTRKDEGVEPGKVLEVVERGYRLDGKVLRPARVIVSE